MVLLAVHIADGVLNWPWLAGGFAITAVLAWLGAWKIRDEEIPRVALLTAAFFVASQIHVRIGPTSVHLILNGLVGVILGWRAALAIPVGLLLQATLLGHGGVAALGVNCCVMLIPALLARPGYLAFQCMPWLRRRWFRDLLVGIGMFAWLACLIVSVVLLLADSPAGPRLHGWALDLARFSPWPAPTDETPLSWAAFVLFHPFTLVGCLLIALAAVRIDRRLENDENFLVGLLLGQFTVLETILLNGLVLAYGAQENWETLAKLVFVAHLPIAAVEGIVLGFTLSFLAKVRPDILGRKASVEA
ncbi:MAG TPA: CbiM family transporter [Gemmataceae bacterium]|nr:CbiM family transporter [Gemmataceae bacterium]